MKYPALALTSLLALSTASAAFDQPLTIYADAGYGITFGGLHPSASWHTSIGMPFFQSNHGAIDVSVGGAIKTTPKNPTYEGMEVRDYKSFYVDAPKILYKYWLWDAPTSIFVAIGGSLGYKMEKFSYYIESLTQTWSGGTFLFINNNDGTYASNGSPEELRESVFAGSIERHNLSFRPEFQFGAQFGGKKTLKGLVTVTINSEQLYASVGLGF